MKPLSEMPTRYLSALFCVQVAEFMFSSVTLLDIDAFDFTLVNSVIWGSTVDFVSRRKEAEAFGSEGTVFPDEARLELSIARISTMTGINRETARRRLAVLCEKGLVAKGAKGYYFPAQYGEADKTAELRLQATGHIVTPAAALEAANEG